MRVLLPQCTRSRHCDPQPFGPAGHAAPPLSGSTHAVLHPWPTPAAAHGPTRQASCTRLRGIHDIPEWSPTHFRCSSGLKANPQDRRSGARAPTATQWRPKPQRPRERTRVKQSALVSRSASTVSHRSRAGDYTPAVSACQPPSVGPLQSRCCGNAPFLHHRSSSMLPFRSTNSPSNT